MRKLGGHGARRREGLGLKLFAPTCRRLPSPQCCRRQGVDSSAIVKEFRERFAMVVANGQGEMKGKIFRIAHLGYYDYLDAIGVIGALEHVLPKVARPRHIEYGLATQSSAGGVRACRGREAGRSRVSS